MEEEQLRVEALRLALNYVNHEGMEDILKRAEDYYKFLVGGLYEFNPTV